MTRPARPALALLPAVRPPPPRLADTVAPAAPPARPAHALPANRVAAASTLSALARGGATWPECSRLAANLAVDPFVAGRAGALSGLGVAKAAVLAEARLTTVAAPAVRAGEVAVAAAPARTTGAGSTHWIAAGVVAALAAVLAVAPVLARLTRRIAERAPPTGLARARPANRVADGVVLTIAGLGTVLSILVEGAGPVAVGARVARLAGAVTGPGVAERGLVVVAGACQRAAWAVTVLCAVPRLALRPAPAQGAAATPSSDVALAAIETVALLAAVGSKPARLALGLALSRAYYSSIVFPYLICQLHTLSPV